MLESYKKLKTKLDGVKEAESLKKYCTLQVGGLADYLYVANNITNLIQAVKICHELKIDYYVLGQGSNVVPSDNGFKGLVIINRSNNLTIISGKRQVLADSGVPLARLVMETANHKLSGLEHLFSIPGTIGGAVFGNAGWQGWDTARFVRAVTIFNLDGTTRRVFPEWLKFGYRTSKIKTLAKNKRPVILTVLLQLTAGKQDEILNEISQAKSWRQTHQPIGVKTCGSVFKNPSGNTAGKSSEQSAGYLLEQIGAKKISVGGASVSPLHANWIINDGTASATDIRRLVEKIRRLVDEKFSVVLEEEIEFFGKW